MRISNLMIMSLTKTQRMKLKLKLQSAAHFVKLSSTMPTLWPFTRAQCTMWSDHGPARSVRRLLQGTSSWTTTEEFTQERNRFSVMCVEPDLTRNRTCTLMYGTYIWGNGATPVTSVAQSLGESDYLIVMLILNTGEKSPTRVAFVLLPLYILNM